MRMAFYELCILLVALCCTTNASCAKKIKVPDRTSKFNETLQLMAEKEVLQLGSPSALRIIQKGGHQKIYLATVDGNSRTYFCIYKSVEQENDSRAHFVFKRNNSEEVIATGDGNELILTNRTVGMKRSKFVFAAGKVTISHRTSEESRIFSTDDGLKRDWMIKDDILVLAKKSSDLCSRLFKLR